MRSTLPWLTALACLTLLTIAPALAKNSGNSEEEVRAWWLQSLSERPGPSVGPDTSYQGIPVPTTAELDALLEHTKGSDDGVIDRHYLFPRGWDRGVLVLWLVFDHEGATLLSSTESDEGIKFVDRTLLSSDTESFSFDCFDSFTSYRNNSWGQAHVRGTAVGMLASTDLSRDPGIDLAPLWRILSSEEFVIRQSGVQGAVDFKPGDGDVVESRRILQCWAYYMNGGPPPE